MTVSIMRAAIMHDDAPGRGERRLSDNRKRYRRIIIGLAVSGGLIGGMLGGPVGYHIGRSRFHDLSFPPHLQWLAVVGVALFVIAVAVGSWIYFRAIDELEYDANKLAGLIGINVYAMLYMTWWPLAKVGVAPAPHGETIFLLTMASAIAAFCWRRFR